jgi:glycosyltransferase involved in cell wall biosynthesis
MAARERMRVGLVIGQLGYGGAEGQLYELARALAVRHDVVVYCLSERIEPFGRLLQSCGIPIRLLPARGGMDLRRVVGLARALRADRIDVVHAFLYIASAYAYLASLLVPGIRLVSSARNCKEEPSAVRRAIVRRAFRRSDAVICNSAEMARFAADYYRARPHTVRVVYNGVDAERFSPAARARAVAAGDGPVIGTVGRIEKQKNLDVFLAAAGCVSARHPGARFEIVGEGTERARLEGVVRERRLADAVRFRGTTRDVPAFLGELDQFWLTSDWEGTPNVVLEAMAAGCPVIATRVGGTPELIEDRRTGILVDAGDAEAICAASLLLAADPAAARRMGLAASTDVHERFSLTAMAAATSAVYESVIGRRP